MTSKLFSHPEHKKKKNLLNKKNANEKKVEREGELSVCLMARIATGQRWARCAANFFLSFCGSLGKEDDSSAGKPVLLLLSSTATPAAAA